ncbi:MAG: sugar ABC transporter permease, partial [Chloroflexales bacterium]|nr:sugar ABC transporter permease [Chloroflexales bacterium]
WYLTTLGDYALAAAGIALAMFLTYRLLPRLGVSREAATGYALIMPWLLGFAIWTAYPIAASLYYSFTDYNVFQPPAWLGLDNYARILTHDSEFWPSLRLTMLYGVISLPLGLAGALGVAMLLARDVRGTGLWRTLYYLPAVLPGVAVVLLWQWLLGTNGLFNIALSPIYRLIGADRPSWFTDERYVLPGLVIMSLWGVFGSNAVIMLAGLKNIPTHLYDAVAIDGGGAWVKFRHVTLPMVSPTLFYTLILGIIAAVKTFEPGLFIKLNPRTSGTFLQVLIYANAFAGGNSKMGYAAAMSWIMLLIILALTLLTFRSSAAFVFYEGERS